MKLEGRIAGPWVEECRRAWMALAPALPSKKLCLDLCGVTYTDMRGTELLREIYRATSADIVANSPLTEHFAEQAMQQDESKESEGV